MPSSAVISWMRCRRSTSACEYRRVPLGERLGSISPRASYIRSVCGCMSASSAATEIMNTPRSPETSTRVLERVMRVRRVAIDQSSAPPPAAAPARAWPPARKSFARGSPFITLESSSTARSCSSDSDAGTSITKR